MKQVYIARHSPEAHLVRGLLEAEGIPAEVRGEMPFGVRGEAPLSLDTLPSVWITDDRHLEKAMALVARYDSKGAAEEPAGATWLCPGCGESCESQFTECWKCGASRPSAPPARPDSDP